MKGGKRRGRVKQITDKIRVCLIGALPRPALPFELGCMLNKMEQPWNASCIVCTRLL